MRPFKFWFVNVKFVTVGFGKNKYNESTLKPHFCQSLFSFVSIVGVFKEFLKILLSKIKLKMPRHNCFLTEKCETWYVYTHKKILTDAGHIGGIWKCIQIEGSQILKFLEAYTTDWEKQDPCVQNVIVEDPVSPSLSYRLLNISKSCSLLFGYISKYRRCAVC